VRVVRGQTAASGKGRAELTGAPPRQETSDALAELYELHFGAALRLAYLLTGEVDLAEDLVQDAFVRLIGRFGQLRSPDAFDAYLRRTVVNLSYSVFRRRRVERAYLAREAGGARQQLVVAPDVEGADELWTQLQGLVARQRAVLVLRYYEDLSEQQTAEVLGCPVRTVKSLVARGLAAMRARQEADR
jgi:RNA polymerase sigma-70 factor (sigma-E family)